MPSMTGESDDSYVRHMLVKARNKGWHVVVFNSQGCADSLVTTPQFYVALITVASSPMSLVVSTSQRGYQQSDFTAFDSIMDAIYDPLGRC
nr:embryogenesis-associated protein EMB8 [Tanacetum cinerariifolium]